MELEMSISAGQVVAVLATHDDGWWEGEFVDPTTGLSTRGIFPSNFTRKIE
ncbi:formin-binding protein [Entomophthora muscae]|nr:formin-binding protein [Entomophthora muscae]